MFDLFLGDKERLIKCLKEELAQIKHENKLISDRVSYKNAELSRLDRLLKEAKEYVINKDGEIETLKKEIEHLKYCQRQERESNKGGQGNKSYEELELDILRLKTKLEFEENERFRILDENRSLRRDVNKLHNQISSNMYLERDGIITLYGIGKPTFETMNRAYTPSEPIKKGEEIPLMTEALVPVQFIKLEEYTKLEIKEKVLKDEICQLEEKNKKLIIERDAARKEGAKFYNALSIIKSTAKQALE